MTPGYILDNWTSEMFVLMTDKLIERKQREADAVRGKSMPKVSDTRLFNQAGKLIKVVKKHAD